MDLRTKYQIPQKYVKGVLTLLQQKILNHLPSKAVSTKVVVDEYFVGNSIVSIQRIYGVDQLEQGRLKGKPQKIYLVSDSEKLEFGLAPVIELQKMLRFVNYQSLGSLSQVRTGFLISDDLIQIPVTLNEVNELGCFIEIGAAAGPPVNLQQTLKLFQDTLGIDAQWAQPAPYSDLLQMKVRT